MAYLVRLIRADEPILVTLLMTLQEERRQRQAEAAMKRQKEVNYYYLCQYSVLLVL